MNHNVNSESAWSKGFTLIELVVTLSIASFFLAALVGLVGSTSRSYRAQERMIDAQQDVRAAMDFMARDIRMAGADPMRSSGAGIVMAATKTLHFTADLNMNNAIDTGISEDVTYNYDSANQRIERITPTATPGKDRTDFLIENVAAMSFTYLNNQDQAVVALDDIVTVLLTITTQARDEKGATFNRTLSTNINLRNRSIDNPI